MLCAARWIRATLALVVALGPAPCLAEINAASGSNTAYAHAMRAINPRLHETQSRIYAATLLSSAARMHLDPRLMMAVVTVESGWNTRALSPDGAEGLGQFKPETARELGIDTWSARSNLRGVAVYLHQLLGMFKSSRNAMRAAIASYNAGPYAVKAAGGAPPAGEPRRYVARVFALWHHFKARLGLHPTVIAVAAALGPLTPQRVMRDQAAYWGAPNQ